MLQLIPSWVSYRQLRSRLRSKRSAIQLEYSQRALRFEQLEDRRVLAGGVIPTSVQAALAANLTPVLMNSLQSTSNLPVIGSALNDQAFVSSQVSQLIDQIDTASATPGAVSISVAPDLKTTFSINTPLHSTGSKNIQISGNGLSPFNLSKDPKLNQNAYLSLWVDIWYRLSFTVDPSTGTTTFQDVGLSGVTPTVSSWSTSFGLGGPSWNLSSPAPNTPLSVVVMAATSPSFQADGDISKIATTIKPHAASVIASGNPASLEDLTYLYSTVDISMGNFAVGPSGTVVPPTVQATLNGRAHVSMDLAINVTDPIKVGITTNMVADWTFTNIALMTPPPPAQFGDLPFVEFKHVTVDLGTTIGGIGDALAGIQEITNSPVIHDFLALMDTEVPIIDKKIRDIAAAQGLISGGFADALSALSFINSLYVTGQGNNGVVDVGSFRIADPRQSGPLNITQTTPSNGAPTQVHGFLHNAFGLDLPNVDQQYGLHFNFLEDPVNYLFPVLAGENRTLVSFAIPPIDLNFSLDDIFDEFGSFELFSDYPGVSAHGSLNVHAEVSVGYDMTGIQRGANSKAPDKTDQNFGLYIDTAHTKVSVTGSMVLEADAGAFSVDGGIYAGFVGVPEGHLDPANPNYLRAGFLLSDPEKMFLGYGAITAKAHFDPGDKTLVDETLLDFDVGPWDTNVSPVGGDHIIQVNTAAKKENIFVLQTHLDPSSNRPIFGAPDEYVLGIEVIHKDLREYYRLGKYEKQGNGTYTKTETYSTANLIYVPGETTIAGDGADGLTLYIDDLDGGNGASTPVNAVVLGTNKNDTLKYFGDGKAIIVGFEGDDTIRSAPAAGIGAGSQLVAEFVDSAKPLTNDLNLSTAIWDKINAARVGAAPQTTKNSITGSGGADLAIISPGDSAKNFSINSTVFTSTPPPPPGRGSGLGLDSPGSNLDFAPDESTIEIVAGDIAGPAGAIIGGHNHIVFKAAVGTSFSTGTLDLSVVNTSFGAALHAQGSQINFTAQGITEIEIGSFGGTLHIGDLSSLGVVPIVVNSLINSAGTATTIDAAPVDTAASIQIGRDYSELGQMSIIGAGLAPNVVFLGLSHVDSVLVNLYGGMVAVADLVGAGLATLRINNSKRNAGSSTAAAVTLENKAASVWLTPDGADADDIRVTSNGEPAVILDDVRTIDTLTMNLAGNGSQKAFFDASHVKGALNINGGGGAAAVDDVTLAKVGTEAVVTVDGGSGQTKLNFGRNYLSEIKHDATATRVELHIDNIGAADARVMTIAPTTFRGWDAGGGLAPTLFYSQLQRALTVDAGGGDVYLLDGTPLSITNIVLDSKSDVRSRIYSDNWQSPIWAKDDWAIYLGQRISTNGTVQRTKHLTGLSNVAVTFDFTTSTAAATNFVVDGELDAPGVQYTVGGLGGLAISNDTVHLTAAINGYRVPDQAYVYIPGGTVNADLHYSGVGKLYFDGQARLAGTNATAANNITIEARYGAIDMTPLSQYNSFIDMVTDVYVLGSMTQDSLAVTVPTNVVLTPAITHDFQLHLNPDVWWEVPTDPRYLMSWFSGARPEFFMFENVDAASWDAYYAPGIGHGDPPNPFDDADLPYGIVLPHVDSSIKATFYHWEIVDGVRTLLHSDVDGSVRQWVVDPDPVAVNNEVQLDASQLRGNFEFNVQQPNYDFIKRLEHDTFHSGAVTQSADFNAPFWIWGTPYDYMRIAFGQSNITLSNVNPELAVGIDGGNTDFSYNTNNGNDPYSTVHATVVGPYPLTKVNIGAGVLANLNGNVAVNLAELEVDDRDATVPNIIGMNVANGITWTSASGGLQTLTVTNLRNDLTLTGSPLDRFAAEGTPDSVASLTIRNFAPAVEGFVSPGIYVMGMQRNRHLTVTGNFGLFVGQRLNANGSVTAVGDLSNLANFSGSYPNPSYYTLISYNYTGAGRGTVVYDASHFESIPTNFSYNASITADPDNSARTAFQWGYSFSYPSTTIGNKLDFGGNTDFFVYAPSHGFNWTSGRGILIDNRSTTASLHYISSSIAFPNQPNDQVVVYGLSGPLAVSGSGQPTFVTLIPQNNNGDIYNLITGDVTVSNVALRVAPTISTSAPVLAPRAVTLSGTQLTGLTGGVINFSNLTDYSIFSTPYPGLNIGLPHYAMSSVSILDTPTGVTTAMNTVDGVTAGAVNVAKTTGALSFARSISLVSGGSDPRNKFQSDSFQIGDGDLDDIQGEIRLGISGGQFTSTSALLFDNRGHAGSQEVATSRNSGLNAVQLTGMAPAAILWYTSQTSPIDIYGAADTHYTISASSDSETRVFAHENDTVDLFAPEATTSQNLPNVTILGAGTVNLNSQATGFFIGQHKVTVLPDPARPDDTTLLNVDLYGRSSDYWLDNSGGGMGRIADGSNQATASPIVLYQSNRTHLQLRGSQYDVSYLYIKVVDTPAIDTTIDPGMTPLFVMGTSNPLAITTASPEPLTIGNNGDAQQLTGPVSITVEDSALAKSPIVINDSSDSAARSVTIAQPASDSLTVTGLASQSVPISGTHYTLSLMGGTGNNSLTGPDLASSWLVSGANSGTWNRTIAFSGMKNLVSGSANDNFLFKPAGSLAGNLDGGDGTDSLYYTSGMLTGSDVIDLPNHIAPRVGGQALNLETSGSFALLGITNPGSKQFQAGAPITPFTIGTSGGFGTKVFSATNLAPGISFNSATGTFSGTPTNETLYYFITVTVTDDTGSASANFNWQSQAGILITSLPSQTRQVNEPINLQVVVQNAYGTTITYSATNLPPGLSINAQTGLISGTITDGAQNTSPYFVQLQVTDGTHTANQSFSWTVQKQFIVVKPSDQRLPTNMFSSLQMIAINAGGPVTWTASGLPSGLLINATTGLISGTLANYGTNSNFNVSVSARDTSNNVLKSTSFSINAQPGFTANGVQNRTSAAGSNVNSPITISDPIHHATINVTSVTGIPTGLTFDPVSGAFTGRIDDYADTISPYSVTVTFTNQTYGYTWSTNFSWTVTPSIVLGNPGNQSHHVGDAIDVAIPVLREFGLPPTFSADGLPLGLSIGPQTGHITGTVAPQTAGDWSGNVVVSATDGAKSGNVSFTWNVTQSAANVVQLADPLTGGIITLTSPVGTSLSAEISSPDNIDFPPGIEFTSGFVSITLRGLQNGAAADVSIAYSSPASPTEYYIYGPSSAGDVGWYDFLYQPDSGATGAEFVPGGNVVLHLVDGALGDSDQDANGAVTIDLSAPAVTRLTLLQPDTVRTLLGDTVNLPIDFIYSHGTVAFSATGLPDGLSIDPASGVISGAVTTNATPGYSPVTVSATDGVSISQITFGWIVPSFQFADIGAVTLPEGAPIHLPLLDFGAGDTDVSYTITGLPNQFNVDANGILQGAFDFTFQNTGQNGSYSVTVNGYKGLEFDSTSFTINTVPGFSVTGVDDQRDWVGDEINSQIQVTSPYGHQLNVSVTGLPSGLTIDGSLAIQGTIANIAPITTIDHVMVTVENETLGYTFTIPFDWNVRRVPTIEELNAGTPAGTPKLAGILDPRNPAFFDSFHGVTYVTGGVEHTVVYFRTYGSSDKIWQIDNGVITEVVDIDPNFAIARISSVVSIPGHGILFADSNYRLWLADEAGARVVAINASYLNSEAVSIGDSSYVVVADSSFVGSIIRIQFDGSGTPTTSTVNGTTGVFDVTAFAGGIVFKVNESGTSKFKWIDAATGVTRDLYSASPSAFITAIGVAPGAAGTENFFFLNNSGGQNEVRVLNSAEWQNPIPVTTVLTVVSDIYNFPKIVGGKLFFIPFKVVSDSSETQVWISDGTTTGTHTIGAPFIGYSWTESVTEVAVTGTDLYLLYKPVFDYETADETTLAAQIWKLDTLTESLIDVADFYGPGFANFAPHNLVAAGDRVFFNLWDNGRHRDFLWECVPGSAPSIVEPNASNGFFNPDQVAFVDGSLYFAAQSEAVTDLNGNPTRQPWVLDLSATPELPGDYNHDGSVDAGDYVVWRKTLNTQETYNVWRANFGRSLMSGGGFGAAAGELAAANAPVSSAISESAPRSAIIINGPVHISTAELQMGSGESSPSANLAPDIAPADNSSPGNSHDATPLTDSLSNEAAFSEFGVNVVALRAFHAVRSSKQRVAIVGSAPIIELRRRNDLLLESTQRPVDSDLRGSPDSDFDILSEKKSRSDSDEVSLSAVEDAFEILALE